MLQRVTFGVFAAIGVVFIPTAIVMIFADAAAKLPVALLGLACIAALEIAWVRVGSVPHRTPAISVPIVAVPALVPLFPHAAIVGMVMLGILIALLVESRRVDVSVYSAGLAGVACLSYFLVTGLLTTSEMTDWAAVAAASVVYVLFVLSIDVLRIRLLNAPADRGGRMLISPLRLGVLLVGVAAFTSLSARWADTGLPLPGAGRTNMDTGVGTLIGCLVLAIGVIVLRSVKDMRRRLNGLVVGSSLLSAARGDDDTANIAASLCRAAGNAVGVQSIVVQDTPAGPGAIGAAVSFSAGKVHYLVARRDSMDGAFSAIDRQSLQALVSTAELAVQARLNVAGLTVRANTDPLTGLPNYGAFQEVLDTINADREQGEAIAVLFIDVDDFKRLNDMYGHQAGDTVLREIGQRLRHTVRSHDVVARVGGDEFVIILTRLASLAEAKAIAEVVLAASASPLTLGEDTIRPSLSIGLAYSAVIETDVSSLVNDADQSMLMVKKSRRRGAVDAGASINISAHRSSRFNDSVAHAIDDNELTLAYQPIVSLVTGRIWAFEALLRYSDAELGAISPPTLVEKAKSLGRFDDLTRQIAEKAMSAATKFHLAEPDIVCITINIEAGQLVADRLGAFLENLNGRYPHITLCLELNERSATRVSTEIRQQANRLREVGILIALDDYGSEDSSVDSLVRVPMDILKIDRSLVDDLDDIRQREVLTALQGFGDKLEYSMIVEGVENEQIAMQLALLGIRGAQGFHFGVPQKFDDVLARLREYGAAAVVPAHPAHVAVVSS